MLRKYLLPSSLVLVLLLGAPAAASPLATEAADSGGHSARFCARSFDRTVTAFDEAFFARDLDRFMANYHPDATVITTTGLVRPTLDEIRAGFAGLFRLEFTADIHDIKRVVEGCRVGIVVSDFRLKIPSVNFESHFVNELTWTFERGRWRLLMDHSTNLPAPPPPPAAAAPVGR